MRNREGSFLFLGGGGDEFEQFGRKFPCTTLDNTLDQDLCQFSSNRI